MNYYYLFLLLSVVALPSYGLSNEPVSDPVGTDGDVVFTISPSLQESSRTYREIINASNVNQAAIASNLALQQVQMAKATGDSSYAEYADTLLSRWQKSTNIPSGIIYARAQVNQFFHRLDAAYSDYKLLVLRGDQSSHQALFNMAIIHQQKGEVSAAKKICTELQYQAPLHWKLCQGYVLSASLNYPAGNVLLKSALIDVDITEDNYQDLQYWILTALADSLLMQNKESESEQYYEKALLFDSTFNEVVHAYIDLLIKRKRFDRALSILQTKPSNINALVRIARIYQYQLNSQNNKILYEEKKLQLSRVTHKIEISINQDQLMDSEPNYDAEIYYSLYVTNNPMKALSLSKKNWKTFKRLKDAHYLYESSRFLDDHVQTADVASMIKRDTLYYPIVSGVNFSE